MPVELSVAIIFKNEIRCLERCMKSLQPLRERISTELVMADTGSSDGSRAVAEQYADVVFDFPWVNDFSAARNAVLERCTGRWVLMMDCDEWLGKDIAELTRFLKDARKTDAALLMVRNYVTPSLDQYGEVSIMRLLRAASHPHYVGAIHEQPIFDCPVGNVKTLGKTMLHHDGYVMLNDGSAAGKAKRERNLALLRKELARSPNDLRRLLEFMEAGDGEADYAERLRHGLELIELRAEGWQDYGPALLRFAIFDAYNQKLSELEKWLQQAHELFPDSYFTRIDVSFIEFVYALQDENAEKAAIIGESFLIAQHDFKTDPKAFLCTTVSPLQRGNPYWAQYVRLRLANLREREGNYENAIALLSQTEWTELDARHTTLFLTVLKRLESDGADVGVLLTDCWGGIRCPVPSEQAVAERVAAFRKMVSVEESVAEKQAAEKELYRLAAKVKEILEKYPADDPAVIDLKNSEAYKKIAHLIKGREV